MQDYEGFYKEAKELFRGRVYKDYLRCFAYGVDASCYSLTPKLVCLLKSESEIIKAFFLSKKYNTPLCFRGAGTSLSGQSSCDSILVILDSSFSKIKISKNARSIMLDAGVIGSDANLALKEFNKKIGPDPATIAAAHIAGIVNNNSSGMCCGVKQNSYNTIKSIRVILADGFLLDTSDEKSISEFKKTHKKMIDELLALRAEILKDKALQELIRKKYKIKNTTGYSINALLDFEDIIDIITHLFVGSEGTLGFLSRVELECVEDKPYKACALLFYEDIIKACEVVNTLASLDELLSSAEIMDYACLKTASKFKGVPEFLKSVKKDTACILIQTENDNEKLLDENIQKIKNALSVHPSSLPLRFSKDEKECASWWKIRKGLLPIAASARKKGTSVITEDICFELKDLARGISELLKLFKKHSFSQNAILLGHALAGNMHFIITPNLNDKKEFENFSNLISDMAKMIASFGGSIKAEHGTGRMIAPFVELEWGKKAYKINKRIKEIFDEKRLINPDVIISDDKDIYKKNIKEITELDQEFLEGCMDCGFCEKNCPSNKLSLSPRQRIALQRELKRLQNLKDEDSKKKLKELKRGLKYFSNETCAACSMCEELCPIGIDTARLALEERKKSSNFSKKLASYAYENFSTSIDMAKFSLKTSSLFHLNKLSNFSISLRKSLKFSPVTRKFMPRSNSYELKNKHFSKEKSVIYFTSCINRAFAPSHLANDKRSIQEVFENICKKAAISVLYPKEIKTMCCGKAFENYEDIVQKNLEKNKSILKKLSKNGSIPIVIDHSACSAKLIKDLKAEFLIYDLSTYLLKEVLPKLEIRCLDEDIALYSMCASKKMGIDLDMKELAKKCTSKRILEHNTACCGFAGYKGFFTPELNINATKNLARFYEDKNVNLAFSSSSTCEIGLSDATNISWQHIVYLLDKVSEVKNDR